MKRTLVLTASSLLFCGAALAQGADDCASAQVITGLGPHAFNNNSATLDGPADCNGQFAYDDVWFLWTAPQTGGNKLKK